MRTLCACGGRVFQKVLSGFRCRDCGRVWQPASDRLAYCVTEQRRYKRGPNGRLMPEPDPVPSVEGVAQAGSPVSPSRTRPPSEQQAPGVMPSTKCMGKAAD